MILGMLESVLEEESSIEDTRKNVAYLRERQKAQARLLVAWKTRFRHQNRSLSRLQKDKDEYLKTIQSQLLHCESLIKKGRQDLDAALKQKDEIINRQHQLICSLTIALLRRGGHQDLKKIIPGIKLDISPPPSLSNCSSLSRIRNTKNFDKAAGKRDLKNDLESLNDSDSAIMMEDAYDSLIVLPSEKGEIKVMRSVSDALEMISRGTSLSIYNNNSNVKASSNQNRRQSSLSSTPSGSSEESDESPSSTMTKGWTDKVIPGLDEIDPVLSCQPLSIFDCPLDSTSQCSSFTCSPCDSSSTTPLVRSPNTSRPASPTSSPPSSPISSCTDVSRSLSGKFSSDCDTDHSDTTLSDVECECDDQSVCSSGCYNRRNLMGSYEKLNSIGMINERRRKPEEKIQVTYNRVMSNHRNVTKPKDVKYKRINKAKSRSLEELRGKLKLWDGKQCIVIETNLGTLAQSEA